MVSRTVSHSVAASLAAAFICSGCRAPGPTLHVQVKGPDRAPLVGLEITALPFDPSRVLDSLAAAAPVSQPTFPELEAALEAYQPLADARLRAISGPWRALYDSVAALADTLQRLERHTARYARLYARFQTMYGRLAQQTAQRDDAIREIGGDYRDLAERAQTAAESLRAWEEEALAPYPAVARSKIAEAGRPMQRATTDSTGNATLTLSSGVWWLVARWPDPVNPFQEYAWHQRVHVTDWLPTGIPLTLEHAERRWRH